MPANITALQNNSALAQQLGVDERFEVRPPRLARRDEGAHARLPPTLVELTGGSIVQQLGNGGGSSIVDGG